MRIDNELSLNKIAIPFLRVSPAGLVSEANIKALQELAIYPGMKFDDLFTKLTLNQLKTATQSLQYGATVQLFVQPQTKRPNIAESTWIASCQKMENEDVGMMLLLPDPIFPMQEVMLEKGGSEEFEVTNEAEAKATIEALRNLLESFSENTLQLDRMGYYQIINDKNPIIFEDLKNLTGHFWQDLRSDLSDELWMMVRESQVKEDLISKEFLVDCGAEEPSWIKVSVRYVDFYTFISYSDISFQKKELEKLVHDERLSTIGILAGGLAHQYNNLHHVVLSLIDQAKSETDYDERRSFLNSAASLIEKGSDLSQSLLAHLRDNNDDVADVSVKSVFNRVELLVRDELLKLKCQVEFLSNGHYVKANPTSLDQVLVNLVLNGAHACMSTGRTSKIQVSASVNESNGKLEIFVEDNGSGISAKNIPHLFTPLFSTKGVYAEKNSSLANIKGTGLGLSLAKQLVGQQNGQLSLHETSPEGTTFKLELQVGEKQKKTKDRKNKTFEAPKTKSLKALVIDDSIENRRLVRVYLQDYIKEFKEQENGQLNVELLSEFRPDIIFVDWLMPMFSGNDFLTALENSENQKHLLKKAVIFTGLNASDEIALWKDKVRGVITKPVSRKTLIQLIGA